MDRKNQRDRWPKRQKMYKSKETETQKGRQKRGDKEIEIERQT